MHPDQQIHTFCSEPSLLARTQQEMQSSSTIETYLCTTAHCCLHVCQTQTLARDQVGQTLAGQHQQHHHLILPHLHNARWRCCHLRCCGHSCECPSCECCLLLRPLQQVQELRCCLHVVLVWEAPQVSVKALRCCQRLLQVQGARCRHCLPQQRLERAPPGACCVIGAWALLPPHKHPR